MSKLLSSIKIPRHKNTEAMAIETMPVPAEVVILMSQHIGAPCKPIVKAGDAVKVGQLIGESDAFVSAPIHSSVSGTVKAIDKCLTARGAETDAVIITTDGLQTPDESVSPREINNREDLVAAAKDCGLVGLGGAGFPTHAKLSVPEGSIDTLLINGAECEPYITSDFRMIAENGKELLTGIELILKHLGIPKAIIGIESEEGVATAKKLTEGRENISVRQLKRAYPAGAEKVLIYETTGKVVEEGKLPKDVGIIVMNVGSVVKLADFIATGMPLVDKVVTVDGAAVKEHKNVRVPIGTRIEDIVNFCGGYNGEPAAILLGGPMMGTSCRDDMVPLTKTNNALLVFDAKEAALAEETACIRCGRCMRTCPVGLNPAAIDRAYHAGDAERLKELKVNICMECGCCSYVCPAKRHLVVYNQMAKKMIR